MMMTLLFYIYIYIYIYIYLQGTQYYRVMCVFQNFETTLLVVVGG